MVPAVEENKTDRRRYGRNLAFLITSMTFANLKRPFGTQNAFAGSPTLERVGYSRFSLWEMPAKTSKLQTRQ